MLSRAQQILLKRAQKECGLDDADYRDAIATVSGMADCRSSTDPRLTDRHVDNLLSYFEAIYWRGREAGMLLASCKPDAIFRQRGYWQSKNPKENTSRDRYGARSLQASIHAAESELNRLGFGFPYLRAIQNKLRNGNARNFEVAYLATLNRTLASKKRKAAASDNPF